MPNGSGFWGGVLATEHKGTGRFIEPADGLLAGQHGQSRSGLI